MSTIPPNTNNSVFEETKSAIRRWLADNKQLDIIVGYGALKDHIVVDISPSRDETLFESPGYAACVKFALEYKRGE